MKKFMYVLVIICCLLLIAVSCDYLFSAFGTYKDDVFKTIYSKDGIKIIADTENFDVQYIVTKDGGISPRYGNTGKIEFGVAIYH